MSSSHTQHPSLLRVLSACPGTRGPSEGIQWHTRARATGVPSLPCSWALQAAHTHELCQRGGLRSSLLLHIDQTTLGVNSPRIWQAIAWELWRPLALVAANCFSNPIEFPASPASCGRELLGLPGSCVAKHCLSCASNLLPQVPSSSHAVSSLPSVRLVSGTIMVPLLLSSLEIPSLSWGRQCLRVFACGRCNIG